MTPETTTIDSKGNVLSVEYDGCSMPADYSFESVNIFVHQANRQYEELEGLCLSLASDREEQIKRLTIALHELVNTPKGIVPESAEEFYSPDFYDTPVIYISGGVTDE